MKFCIRIYLFLYWPSLGNSLLIWKLSPTPLQTPWALWWQIHAYVWVILICQGVSSWPRVMPIYTKLVMMVNLNEFSSEKWIENNRVWRWRIRFYIIFNLFSETNSGYFPIFTWPVFQISVKTLFCYIPKPEYWIYVMSISRIRDIEFMLCQYHGYYIPRHTWHILAFIELFG